MQIQRFEDLVIWKEAMHLGVQIYRLMRGCRDLSLRDQMQRSALSIPSNIAEGYERTSNKEFIRFLHIARASCGELRTQLYFCAAIGIFNRQHLAQLIERTRKLSAMISRYIQARQSF